MNPLAGSPAFVFVFVFIVVLLSVKFFGPQLIRENLKFSQQIDQILTSNPTQPPLHLTPPIKKNEKKRSVSKMKDQVVTIKTHTESSKSELSSRGKRQFKVFCFSHVFWPQTVLNSWLCMHVHLHAAWYAQTVFWAIVICFDAK